MTTATGPHPWTRKGWRFWLCRHCYSTRKAHPRTGWDAARPLRDNPNRRP